MSHTPKDPWEDHDEDDLFAGDYLYEGDQEVIEDIILLTDVCLKFEYWAENFRYWDEDPVFSELCSIKMAKGEVVL